MRKSFDDTLDECIRQLEASGGDIEAVLNKHPDRADDLRPHLQIWASLSDVEQTEATPQGVMEGRQRLLSAIAKAQQEGGTRLMNNVSNAGGLGLRLLGAMTVVVALALSVTFVTGYLHVSFGSAEADIVVPDDVDNDGVPNLDDNCPLHPNPPDADGDGSDGEDPVDGIDNDSDTLVDEDHEVGQEDLDDDGLGDVCDPNPNGAPACLPDVDFNGDTQLNVLDVMFFADAFGSEVGDPNYNPDADLDGDGDVDIDDVAQAVQQVIDCLLGP